MFSFHLSVNSPPVLPLILSAASYPGQSICSLQYFRVVLEFSPAIEGRFCTPGKIRLICAFVCLLGLSLFSHCLSPHIASLLALPLSLYYLSPCITSLRALPLLLLSILLCLCLVTYHQVGDVSSPNTERQHSLHQPGRQWLDNRYQELPPICSTLRQSAAVVGLSLSLSLHQLCANVLYMPRYFRILSDERRH